MSNFNDLYDHVAADRSRAMQLLGIQDIRRKAVSELLAAGTYTEPDNIDDMTDAEREQHKAEAAYALGRPHILETAKMPTQDGDETYAIAVTATSETPNCIALCVQTKLEELYASGIVDRSANHRPRLFIVAANDRPDEDVQGLRTAAEMGVDFDADAVAEAARNITANDDEPEGRNRKERRWFGKKKK